MNTFNRNSLIAITLFVAITLSSCQAIGDIFKAGMGVGIALVVIVVIIIFWLISKAGNKS